MHHREIHIVHFDDHSLFRRGVKDAVEKERSDFKIYGVDEYYSALKHISDYLSNNIQIDVVITDFNHPGPNGYTFASEVKRIARMHNKELPVILLTMSTDENPKIVQGLQENIFDKQLTKASQSFQIIEAIESVLTFQVNEEGIIPEYLSENSHIESNSLTPKIVLLSASYFIIALILLGLMDAGLYYFMNDFVFNILNWFNKLSLFFKIGIILLGGVSLFIALLQLTQRLSTLLGGLIFDRLPQNLFTVISTFVIAITNAVWWIIELWKVPQHYNFWIVCELIILSFFIWTLSAIVMPAKEQLKEYRREY